MFLHRLQPRNNLSIERLKTKGLQRELLFSNHFAIIIRAKGFAIVEEIIMLLLQILSLAKEAN